MTGEPVLVTGGAGYIGSHVVKALGDQGFQPVILDNLVSGNRDAVLCGEFIEGDIQDSSLVASIINERRIRSVIHFAAYIVVPESVRDPFKYYGNNFINSFHLIQTCAASGIRHFVFSSTAAVYGIPDRLPVTETSPLKPINPYGSSKMFTEMLLRDVAVAFPDFNYTALRYFNVAGADHLTRIGQNYQKPTHLITLALRTALGDFPQLKVFGTDYETGDGTAVRDYIHVDDLADAHILALQHLEKHSSSDVFNCGYGRGYSVYQVIEGVKQVTGVDFPVVEAPRREGDPPALVADSTRIQNILGWRPERDDLETILDSAWRWEKRLKEKG